MVSLEDLEKKANQCVKCGLCLNHCPTFRLTGDENRSPRGRIALSQALNSQALPITPKITAHLDSCLECGLCESACPAKVDYISLLKHTKKRLHSKPPRLLLGSWLTSPSKRPYLKWLFWTTQRIGAHKLCALLTRTPFNKITQHYPLIPPIKRPKKRPPPSPTGKKISLFISCGFDFIQQDTLHFCLALLSQLGYAVQCVDQCCGALNSDNPGSWNKTETLIYLDSGCGAHLHRQGHQALYSVIDIINQHQTTIRPWLRELDCSVGLHTPCTLLTPLGQASAVEQFLDWIPKLSWQKIHANGTCCGAGGQHLLTHTQQSTAIFNQTFNQPDNIPNQILTSNSSCLMQFQKALASQSISIAHPITILRSALRDSFWDEKKRGLTNEL